MKVYIVIAAYNEAKRLGNVLNELKKSGYHKIVVVDDGSSDSTFEIATKARVQVLKHVINRGQGAALQTGIKFALMQGADIVVTFDADGQFLVREIKDVVKPLLKDKYQIVLGSRFLGKAVNIPLLKKGVLKLGVIVIFILYGIKLTDSQCGFRAMSRYAAEKININSDRMEHASEIFLEIVKNKLKYKEVPVTVIYDNYSLRKGQDWSQSIDLGLKMIFKRFVK